MSDNKNQKFRLLKLYDILINNTSQTNMLSTGELMEMLAEQGFSVTRKTFYSDIKTLNNNGYEIITYGENGKSNYYYIVNDDFDNAEIKILMDAVQSASFLTKSKTKQLIEKLSRINGDIQSNDLLKNCINFGETKSINAKVYYYIDTINEAITNNKKISFKYTVYNEKGEKEYRKEGKRYIANPVLLVFDDSKYYLLTYNEKYFKLTIYRIDRMNDVQVEQDDIIKPDNIAEMVENMKKQMFSMFHGETINCVIEIEKYMIDIIIDKFGQDIKFYPQENGKLRFTATVQESSAFVSWCIKFGACVKVLEPQGVVERIKGLVGELQNVYLK